MRGKLGLAVLSCSMALIAACGGSRTREPKPGSQSAAPPGSARPAVAKVPYAVLTTSMGKITLRLFPEAAPKAVANFIALAEGTKAWIDPRSGKQCRDSLYKETVFHRVIPGFMIQGGDPTGTGHGGPGYQFEDEFSSARAFDKPGILGMANSGPNTNGSQFFLTTAPTPWLSNRHTVLGEVVDGQAVVDAISRVPRDAGDKPLKPIVLKDVKIEDR